ncbi:MAG TPA: ankyrin repeat domain-containing protein, partial [Steroidobacteraceae bacterium]|nr:ankyrin repeat domain-containing protein [Steroidobacteraceae bacterium]
ARSGHEAVAKLLLEKGAELETKDVYGRTPLLYAAKSGHEAVAKLLLEKGANPNTWDWWGRTPLYVAVDMDSFVNRAVGGLTTAGGAFGPEPQGNANDPLHARDIINMLLADGVDVNTQLHMHRPGRGGNSGRFTDDLLTVGATPLLRAAISYDVDVVKLLLAHGARVDLPNGMGVTPLMAAAGIGRGFHIPIPGRRGLHSGGDALEDRQIATLDTLLEAGADINARITDTSSHTARIARASSMTNRQGQTALYGAISIGSLRVAQYLLDHGARADVADAAGRTPLDATQARAGGRDTPASPEMVALIRKAYAAGGAPPPVAANSPGTAPRALPRGPADPRGN